MRNSQLLAIPTFPFDFHWTEMIYFQQMQEFELGIMIPK